MLDHSFIFQAALLVLLIAHPYVHHVCMFNLCYGISLLIQFDSSDLNTLILLALIILSTSLQYYHCPYAAISYICEIFKLWIYSAWSWERHYQNLWTPTQKGHTHHYGEHCYALKSLHRVMRLGYTCRMNGGVLREGHEWTWSIVFRSFVMLSSKMSRNSIVLIWR